jgi:hypothetical protein
MRVSYLPYDRSDCALTGHRAKFADAIGRDIRIYSKILGRRWTVLLLIIEKLTSTNVSRIDSYQWRLRNLWSYLWQEPVFLSSLCAIFSDRPLQKAAMRFGRGKTVFAARPRKRAMTFSGNR